jgi:hypothetical protein
MSIVVSEEDHSLLSAKPVVGYSQSKDDPFTFKSNNIRRSSVQIGEHSAAYSVLKEYDLLVTIFRKKYFDEIFTNSDLNPNSTLAQNFVKRWRWGKTMRCNF